MKALVLIDIQNDYFPGGRSELVGPEQAARRAASVLRQFRDAALPVIRVRHINTRAGATFLLPDTAGININDAVVPAPGEPVVVKHAPNSFQDTDLAAIIERLGATELVVCGMMTQMCVDATVRAAQ